MNSKHDCQSSTVGRLSVEKLEDRTLLAADIMFAEPVHHVHRGNEVAVVDIDGDGTDDLFTGETVIFGTGDGTFANAKLTRVPASFAFSVGDFDDDGSVDVATTRVTNHGGITNSSSLQITLSQGGVGSDWTGFGSPQTIATTEPTTDGLLFLGITSGDFDSDGDLDLVVGSNEFQIQVFLNNGSSDGQWRGFADPTAYVHSNFNTPQTVTTAQVNGDEHFDLLVSNMWTGEVSVMLGSGDGQFADPVNYVLELDERLGLTHVAVGDLDGDGNLDLVAPHFVAPWVGSASVVIARGIGDGTFAEPELVAAPGTVNSRLVVADFDGDGDSDIAGGDKSLSLLINNGDGTFPEQDVVLFSRCICGLASSDLNADGLVDLVVIGDHSERSVSVLLNTTEPFIPSAGDSTGDGRFDQLDIVQVLQAGKYLTGEPAVFAEGDWNADGVFDQQDIVAALATGTYL